MVPHLLSVDSGATLPPDFCCYSNFSDYIQVVRLIEGHRELLERVLLPQQQIAFTAPPTAQLEVYSGQYVTAFLEDRIPCADLIASIERLIE
jgi:hypothetical protein